MTPRFGVACASRGAFCPCTSQKALGHARPHLAWLACQGPSPFSGWRRQPVRRCSLPLHRPDDEATDASCRALPPGLACWASWGKRTEDPFHGSTPMPPLPRPEAPSTDRSHSPRPFAGAEDETMGRHWSRWLCRRGPASDTHSLVQVRARSHPRAGYSPELVRPRAVYRLLQCVDSRARPPTSRPHRFFVATTEAAARRVTTPEGAANQAVSAQG